MTEEEVNTPKPEEVNTPKPEEERKEAIRALETVRKSEAFTKDDYSYIEAPRNAVPTLKVNGSVSQLVGEAVINGFADTDVVKEQWGDLTGIKFEVEATESPVLSTVQAYSIVAQQAKTDVTIEVTIVAAPRQVTERPTAALDGILAPLVVDIPFSTDGRALLHISAVKKVGYEKNPFKVSVLAEFVVRLRR